MKIQIILSLILFSFVNVHSQEKEYLVTINNDTIHGKIIYKIKDEQGKKRLINPAEVKIIRSIKGVDGDCIIRTIDDKYFIKEIINGRIKVFESIDNAIFYTSKDDGEISFTDFGGFGSRTNAHSQIRILIKDNPQILKEFDSLKGSAKNIFYIIKKYNESYKTIANNVYN